MYKKLARLIDQPMIIMHSCLSLSTSENNYYTGRGEGLSPLYPLDDKKAHHACDVTDSGYVLLVFGTTLQTETLASIVHMV